MLDVIFRSPRLAPLLPRLWILLAAVAVLAFAMCATGALGCALTRPAGLAFALLAALASLIEPPRDPAPDKPERPAHRPGIPPRAR